MAKPLHLRRCHALLAALLLSLSAASGAERTADSTETKIRLMSQSLQAQDAGDLNTARERLETLQAMFPSDQEVQRRLAILKARIAAAEESARRVALQPDPKPLAPAVDPSSTTPVHDIPKAEPVSAEASDGVKSTPAAEPAVSAEKPAMPPIPDDPDGLLEWERARQEQLMAQAKTRLVHARKLADEDRFSDCLGALSETAALLPLNPLTQPLLREIEALRNDMEHRQRVVGYSMGSPAPILTVSQIPLGPEMSASSQAAPTTVEVHLVEMMPDVYADLLVAWGLIESNNPLRRVAAPMIIDPRGRPSYLRKEAPLPTPRQIRLYWALRGAGLKPGATGASKDIAGMVGVIGRFEPASVVKTLAAINGCRLIAAPKVEIRPGHQALLSFKEEGIENASFLQNVVPGSAPTTGLEIKISPLSSPAGMEFAVSPAVIQYEGRLEAGAANTVFSRHEAGCRLKLAAGMTAMMGGLVHDSGRAAAGGETGLQRVPFVGNLLRDLSTASRQREVVIMLTWR